MTFLFVGSSVYSSLLSTPQSPLSPNMQSSPDIYPHSYSTSDTIHALLTKSHTQLSTPQTLSPSSSEDVRTPITSNATDKSSSRKHSSSNSLHAPPPQKKRRVSATSRKERKKEQNKTAALRYRQKKKGEKGDIDDRYSILEEKNSLLKNTLSSLEAEVSYLRKLWDEVERAKVARLPQQ